MADQTQRLEIATVRAEVGSNILYRVANDPVAGGSIPTESGNIQNLKQVLAEIREEGAEKISIATTIYPTAAAGLAATTDGGIFLVQSSDESAIYAVWKNDGGAAVNTGKTAMSSQAIEDALTASNQAAQAAEEAADVATNRTAGFLQPAAEAPATRDDGLPLQVGDRYFNTETETEYLYKDAGWTANDSLAAIAELEGQISVTPEADKVPRANANGKLDMGWLSDELATQADLDLIKSGTIKAEWFDGATDSEIIQSAIDAAMLLGVSQIMVSRAYICDQSLKNRSNVRFIGDGALLGDAAYRVMVIPDHAPAGREPFDDLIPAVHMRNFSANPSPVVVICGSSTGAWSADTVDTGNGVTPMLQRLLSKYNPDKSIEFYNRCIGAQTFATLNSVPVTSSFPAWYTDTSKPWLDYVNELAPDVVFVICGSNDSSGLTRATVKETIDKITAFGRPTDLVFITQPSVCPDPSPAFATFGTRAAQEGRDYAAGLVRSCAQYYKKGLIDANRMGGIVLDGRDILDNASMRVLPAPQLTNGRFAPSLTAIDFSMGLTFVGNENANTAAFLAPANPVFVKIGAGGGNSDAGDIAFIKKNAGGFMVVELYSGGIYQAITTTLVFPVASFTLDVIKTGNVLTLSFNGLEDTKRVSFNIIAAGGEMYPRTGHYNLTTGPWTSVTFNIGLPKLYKKLLTSVQAWGSPNDAAARQMPYGGNGINHFSSLGTREIYGRVMDTDALRGATSDWGEYTPILTSNAATPPSKLVIPPSANWGWSRVGNLVTVFGVVTIADADGTCAFSASLPIVPKVLSQDKTIGLADGRGVTGSGFGDPTNKVVQYQLVGVPSTDTNVRLTFSYRLA